MVLQISNKSKNTRITSIQREGRAEEEEVYLEESIDGRDRIQHDEEEERIQPNAGQHERPLWDKKYNKMRRFHLKGNIYK